MAKGTRVVKNIERAFCDIYEREGVDSISVLRVKDWLDGNTRDGMKLMRLANLLSKRPQFKMVRRERKRGTHETESYWCMDGLGGFSVKDWENRLLEESKRKPEMRADGTVWVVDWPKPEE
jgi:hypothetical protein